MAQLGLYPPVSRKPRLFPGVKRVTLPNQCMSLAEMFRRFVRREPLPVEKQGIYVEGEHDLEKVARMDRVEQEELLDQLKANTSAKEKAAKDKIAEELKKEEEQREATRRLEEQQRQAANPTATGSKAQEGRPA